MKLFLLLLAISLQVSAAALSQGITLSATKAPLREVMQSIRKQSGYQFIIESSYLDIARPVSVVLKAVPVEEALKKIFAAQPFGYVVKNKTVVVKEKDLFLDSEAPLPISGKVTDSDNKPLIGVSVRIKGTNSGATTGENGDYKIVANAVDVLIFSYVGYVTVEMPVNGRQELDVKLERAQSQLGEAVVKGYYSTTKELNTGNVSSIKASDIAKQPVSDPLMALSGRIPGLFIAQTSGVPGASITVRLRGRNSIDNGNDPLYIIDGIPFNQNSALQNQSALGTTISPFINIRPEEIESIDVLKDADATAIYGSRGANGVILITTKKGNADKLAFDININRGVSNVTRKLKLMNTEQYLAMRKEAYMNDGTTPSARSFDINGGWDQDRYTDWQDVFIGRAAHYTNAHTGISGGNGQTNFLINGSYRRENTIFPGDFYLAIGSYNANINHNSKDQKFNLNFNTNYSNVRDQLPRKNLIEYIFFSPNAPALYDSKANLNWENSTFTNPFGELRKTSTIKTESFISNLSSSYEIIDKLRIKLNAGYNFTDLNEVNIIPFTALDPATTDPSSQRFNTTSNSGIKSWLIEPQLSYSNKWQQHSLDILIGATMQESNHEGNSITATGYSSDVLVKNIGAGTIFRSISNIYSLYRYSAFFSLVCYNYKQKYVLNLTARRDGSSRFGPGRQFGNFGAVGAAWIISEEDFFKKIAPVVNFAKLRGSIGRTGNDQLTDYRYLSAYRSGNLNFLGTGTLEPEYLGNPLYGWETIDKIEFGLEMAFGNNRIQFNANYYRNQTDNQLVGYNLPTISGFSTVTANLPAVIQNKGLEFEVNTDNIKSGKFNWRTSANISFPKNKLITYPNLESSPYATRYAIGQPLSANFLYTYKGINPETGIYTFEDYNNDGLISAASDRRPVFIGQQYFGGLNNSFTFKGFSLDVFFQFVKQNGYKYLTSGSPGVFTTTLSNQPIGVLDRWQQKGDQGKFQKYTSVASGSINSAFNNFNASTARIDDASYIRLKNVMFSWDIPAKWRKALLLQNTRLYVQGQNLLVITEYEGIDPENAGTGTFPALPPLKTITAGVQFIF